MLEKPSVSIIIPCYNDGEFLIDAVESVNKCKSNTIELVIVNDGSNDLKTLDILKKLGEAGHRIIHQVNRGLAAARNRGIKEASSPYILPLDADNRIRSSYPQRAIEVMESNPSIDVVYADMELFGDKCGRKSVPAFNLCRLLQWNYIDSCAVFRRSVWEKCLGYDENMPIQGYEDWDLWCRIAIQGGGFLHYPEVLFDYRVRKNSMSSNMSKPTDVEAVIRHIYSKKVTSTIGHFCLALQSWDYVEDQIRKRPIKTMAVLLLKTVLPKIYKKLKLLGYEKH